MNISVESAREAIANAISGARRRAKFAQAYKSIWDDPEGRLVMSDILNASGLLEDIAAPADADSRAYSAGRRAIGLHVIGRLRWSEHELVMLAKEQSAGRIEELSNVEVG